MRAIFQFFHNGRHWYSISIDTQKTGETNFGGLVIWNFSIRLILTKWEPFFNFFIMAQTDIPFLLTPRKPETQTLGGICNLKFFHTIDINEMRAIFQFFHNGWCWYSVSVNTQKTRDPNFGGVGILKFFRMIDINEMRAIFQFFHNGWRWIFNRFSFPNFSIGSVFPVTHLRFDFNIHTWLRIKHLCVDIYVWWPFCTWKTGDTNFPSIQFSKLFHWFSFARHPS